MKILIIEDDAKTANALRTGLRGEGFEVLKSVRACGSKLPVLLLTARDTIEDRVKGLESGADDSLVKPFAFPELLARIRALLRRAGDTDRLRKQLGDLAIDIENRRVQRGSKEIGSRSGRKTRPPFSVTGQ